MKKRVSGGVFALMAGVSLLAIVATPAFAQDAAAPADAPKADDVVVVTGFKKSYADAIKMKRSAVGVSE